MTSTNTQIISYSPLPPSSSSSKSAHQFTYEVFLSFRGEDTRYGFTNHLYQALISSGIRTFRDDEELKRGGVIASELPNAIEESKIFVIIFSKNYATSRWCLDELVEIFKCMATKQRLVLPIFYHVDPSDVRKQSGSYEAAFRDHEKEAGVEKKEKIQKWRTALTKAGNLAGYDLQKYRYETQLIEVITKDILKKLDSKFLLDVSENLVGVSFHLENLKSLIEIESNDVRMIGIYGLGGVGKTTISKVVYNNIFHLFESSVFLENVRERFEGHLSKLQLHKELLNGIMKGKNLKIDSICEGMDMMKHGLRSQKVLLILDDVDKSEQLEFLARKHGWFSPGSRIIITTRDQQLLRVHEVDESYEVTKLGYKELIQLFCQYAFKQNIPKKDYEDVSDDVVHYVDGLPLALTTLGSFLFSKSKVEWECTLQKLKRMPNEKVHNVLKISFDGLEEVEKEIFLDIACFFKGCDKNSVTRRLEHAEGVIRVLSDKCLITLSHNIIGMHELIQQMGKQIVRHDHPKEPEKWSRLWDPDDIYFILKKKMGTEAIEGIFLDMSKSREISFTTEAFRRMERLRLFKVYWSGMRMEYQKLLLPEDFEFPSYNLRYLHWEGYSLESLPPNFEGDNLVELNLECSNLKRLWQSEKRFQGLKVLNLSRSHQFTDMPHFSNMLNLEELNLEFCESLDKVDWSIGLLTKLTLLNLNGCQKIRSLPRTIQNLVSLKRLHLDLTAIQELPWLCKLKSLEYLHLLFCSNLETLPEITKDMKCLKEIDLSGSRVKELPSTIEYLNHLTSLKLMACQNLRSLPSSICRLKSLKDLDLDGCSNLETFPENMEDMECLEMLSFSARCIKATPPSIEYRNRLASLSLEECNKLRSLPSSICRLKSLEFLILCGCRNLETFPEIMEDMKCLVHLDLTETGIKELPSSIGYLNRLIHLSLHHCKNLRSLPSSIGRLKSLEYLELRACPNLVTEDMENLIDLGFSETQNLMDGATPSDLWCLSSLEVLDLSQNNMRHIPAAITELYSLKTLYIDHCNMLEEIPDLPSGLMQIDAHDCPSLGTLSNPSTRLWSSLLKWMKEFEFDLIWGKIRLGCNGIPGWICQQMGSQIRIKLPMNWNIEDDQFLGFAFFVHQQGGVSPCIDLSLKFDEEKCTNQFRELGPCLEPCGEDACGEDEVWLLYCPKTAIRNELHSNRYRYMKLKASIADRDTIKGCGVHLIYSQDHQQNHISLLDSPENSGDSRSTTKDIKRDHDDATHNQEEEPYRKRLKKSSTHLKL